MDEGYEIWNGSLWHGLLLVASNAALWPAMYLSTRRGKMAKSLVMLWTFLASTGYHTCRAWALCYTAFRLSRIGDYLFVYMLIVWILTSLGLRRHGVVYIELHNFLFFLLYGPTMFAVLAEVSTAWLPIVGIGVPVLVTVAFSYKTGNRLFYNKPWTIATFLLVIAAGLFMFIMPTRDYWWAHSIWHLCAMLAALTEELATDDGSPDSAQHRAEAHEKRPRRRAQLAPV